MITSKQTILVAASMLAVFASAANAAEIIEPDIGEPLRDAAVTRAPDGTYYLTGTCSNRDYGGKPDFVSNNGVRLWSSKDLETWTDEGLVYDLIARRRWHDYLSHFYAQPDRPLAEPSVAGIVAPRLHVIDGKYYLTVSSSGHDVRWLVADRPKGRYRDGRTQAGVVWKSSRYVLSMGPGYGSLFSDKDGTTYLVWGPGYMAPLNEKRSDVDYNSATLLLGRVEGYPNADWCAEQFDPRAAALSRVDGRYVLTWAAYTDGAGARRDDSFYAVADRLEGPYCEPLLLAAGSGPVALFETGDRGTMVSYSRDDRPVLAPFRIERPASADTAAAGRPGPSAAPLVMFDYANSRPSRRWAQKVEATGRSKLLPLFDMPLADVCIARGGDGAFYMTGTVAGKGAEGAPDFENNDGIYLWRSDDLGTWLPLGKVWDIETDGGAWQKRRRIPGDNPVRMDYCRGVTAPEIHFDAGTYWLAYSMNGRGTGLLRSTTGKAEGPYEDLGRIAAMGESPSLFVDGGTAYWLWGKGLQMAALGDDRKSLAGPPRDLFLSLTHVAGMPRNGMVDMWDLTGPHMFTAVEPNSKQRRYCLSFSAVTQTFERANRDSVLLVADGLDEPFYGPVRMVPNGGQTSVFADENGAVYASFSGADPSAVFRERPGIVPLEWYGMARRWWPRRVWKDFHTARGPWAELQTPKGLEAYDGKTNFRDPHVFHAPDGWYYFSASPDKILFTSDLVYYRARDIGGPWEEVGKLYAMAQMRDDPNWPEIENDQDKNWNGATTAWEPAMAHTKGTYWISCWFGGHGWGRDVCWKKSIGALLRSTSGKPGGPYVYHSEWQHDWQGLFVDDDGSVYGTAGAGALWKMNDDLTAMDRTWTGLDGRPIRGIGDRAVLHLRQSADGRLMSEDCGYQMIKVEGRYVFTGLGGHCSYDGRTFWADDIRGPYHYMGVIPRLGNSPIVKARDGEWYTAFCQATPNAFNLPRAGLVAYPVTLDFGGDRPTVWPTHDIDHLDEAVYR